MKARNMRVLLAIIITLLSSASLRAVTRPPDIYDIKQISELPQSEINDIYEDSVGFLWIASLDGLYCY